MTSRESKAANGARSPGPALLFAAAPFVVAGCGLLGRDEPRVDPPPPPETFSGRIHAPMSLYPLTIFSSGRAGSGLTISWESCAPVGGKSLSAVRAADVMLQTTNDCAGEQFLAFDAKKPIDLSDWEGGVLLLSVQTDSPLALWLSMQDGSKLGSAKVDLANFGFDPSVRTSVQRVSVPLAALFGDAGELGRSPSLARISRPLQIVASCGARQCLTAFSDIKIAIPPRGPSLGEDGLGLIATRSVSAEALPTRSGGDHHCDPGPCRGMPSAVRVVAASPSGWWTYSAADAPPSQSNDDGGYAITIDGRVHADAVGRGGRLVVVADGRDGDAPDMASFARDPGTPTDIDLASTLAVLSLCPGGECPALSDEAVAMVEGLIGDWLGENDDRAASIAEIIEALLSDGQFLARLGDLPGEVPTPGKEEVLDALENTPLPTVTPGAPRNGGGDAGGDEPAGIAAGNYRMTADLCTTMSGCRRIADETIVVAGDPAAWAKKFEQAASAGVGNCSGDGVTCHAAWKTLGDGSSRLTIVSQACSPDGGCESAELDYVFKKQG